MFRQVQSLEYVAGGKGLTTEIGGRDRFKFFKRPVVPTMEGGTQTVMASAATVAPGGGGLASAAAATLPSHPGRPVVQRSLQPRSQFLQSDNVGKSVKPPRTLDKLQLGGGGARPGARPKEAFADGAAAAPHTGTATTELPATRNMECQTMFRESDTQTDPFTPDYFVEEGQQPEVLAIMELRYGEGLPAGAGEVHMIDRVQRRKRVEASLPQGNDPASMEERLHALEALEHLEWEERETHIKGLQDTRLIQMSTALQRREEAREEQSRTRIEALKNAKMMEVQRRLEQIQERRLTTTRKLATRHANPCGDKETRNLIEAHILYGPRAEAVQTNHLVEKVNTSNYDVRPTLLSFPEGILELERSAVPALETVKTKKLQPPEQPAIRKLQTNYQRRQAAEVLEHLEYANGMIEKSHEVKQATSSIQDLYRATPRLQRPDTPTLQLQGDDEEEKEEAVLLLQRLLRGRAVQNDFYEGKERCHGLIEELQSASNAKDAEYKWVPEQQREMFRARQEATAQSVVDGVEGDIIVGSLDYLFKELTRQQEAARIDHLRDFAEATRKRLEQQEADTRAQERALRAKEEIQYAKLAAASDATVEGYLVQLLDTVIRTTAVDSAVEEELAYSQQLQVHAPPEPTTSYEEENLVCDLLERLVIPAACRRNASLTSQLERQAVSSVAVWASHTVGSSTRT